MEERRLFIGGLTASITAAELLGRLEPFADCVDSMDLHSNYAHCTVRFKSGQHRQKFLTLYNGSKWKGVQLRIEPAKPDYPEQESERLKAQEQQEKNQNERQIKAKKRRLKYQPVGVASNIDKPLTDKQCRGRKFWKRMNNGRAVRMMRMRDPQTGKLLFIDPTNVTPGNNPNRIIKFRDADDCTAGMPEISKSTFVANTGGGSACSNGGEGTKCILRDALPTDTKISAITESAKFTSIMGQLAEWERKQEQEISALEATGADSMDIEQSETDADESESQEIQEELSETVSKERSIALSIKSDMFDDSENTGHVKKNTNPQPLPDNENESRPKEQIKDLFKGPESKQSFSIFGQSDVVKDEHGDINADMKGLFFGSESKSTFSLFQSPAKSDQSSAESGTVQKVDIDPKIIADLATGEDDGIYVGMYYQKPLPQQNRPTIENIPELDRPKIDIFDGSTLKHESLKLFFPHFPLNKDLAKRSFMSQAKNQKYFGYPKDKLDKAQSDAQKYWEATRQFLTRDYKQRHKYAQRMRKKVSRTK